MNRLGITLICAIFVLGAYSQVPGAWFRDWQNAPNSLCSPDSFTVSNTSQTNFLISYNFSSLSLEVCKNNASGNYTAGLTVNSSTGNWVDSNGQQLVYDSVNNAVQFLFSNSTPYLYDTTGAALPQEQTLGYLGGAWTTPTPLGSATLEDCCVPDSLFINPAGQLLYTGMIYVLPSFTLNCSTVNTTKFAEIMVPNLQTANWTSTGYGPWASANYIFDLSNTTQLTFSVANGSNVCGSYSYQKTTTGVKLLNNTWYLDWQSEVMSPYSPSVYQVTPVNNSYMVTRLNYSSDIFETSFLVENLQGQYYDSAVGLGFTYDETTQTLLSIPSGASQITILYSLNGSLIPDPLNTSYWNNPQSTGSSPIPTTCCTPNWAYVTPYTYGFDIEYYLPSDYASISGCQDFAGFINNDTLSSSLTVNTPSLSFSNLIWDDGFGSQIYFASASDLSVITIESFLGDANCSFNLAYTTQPPPPPKPLSSGWMSLNVIALVMMGLVMLLASI